MSAVNTLIGGYSPGGRAIPQNGAGSLGPVPSAAVIDGTPIRVAAIALSAALGLVALRWAGFKFNVGVSN